MKSQRDQTGSLAKSSQATLVRYRSRYHAAACLNVDLFDLALGAIYFVSADTKTDSKLKAQKSVFRSGL